MCLGIAVSARFCVGLRLFFPCCCDYEFMQGFVLVSGCVVNVVGNRSLSKVVC